MASILDIFEEWYIGGTTNSLSFHMINGTVVRKPVSGFPTRSHTNRAVQPQKMARGLKFRIYEVEGLFYPCSENKGADQLRGYRAADLRLCFSICLKPVFSRRGLNGTVARIILSKCPVLHLPILAKMITVSILILIFLN